MSANGSKDDYLNRVADKVAIGNVDFRIDCYNEIIELQAVDIMKDNLTPNSWSLQMKDRTNPILAGIQHYTDNW